MIDPLLNFTLLILMLALYMVAIELRDILHSVIVLAGASILLAVLFYTLQAPDIAITQAAVGAGVTTVIFVIAISRTRRNEE